MKTHDTPYGESHCTIKYYTIGFIISIVLTIIAFGLVAYPILDKETTIICVVFAGILQLVVQLVFFLHLGAEEKPRLNLMSFVFTLFIVAILVIGTLWIMYNLDYNMMDHPVSTPEISTDMGDN